MFESTMAQKKCNFSTFHNAIVGVVGSNCVVIAAERNDQSQKPCVCTLDGKLSVAWSGPTQDALMIIDKAKMYTNSEHGYNSSANRIAEFLVDPEIRMLNNLPALPYKESFMVASCDENERNLYVTDSYGTISQVLASAIGRESNITTKSLETNFSTAKKGILGAIELALQSLCAITKPDANYIDIGVITPNRPFEVVDKNIVQECLNQMTSLKIEN